MATSPTLGSSIRVCDDVLFQELQGEGVLLNLKSGIYFGVDKVGARVWQILEKHSRLSEIVDLLVAEFDVPRDRCAQDLLVLVADMEAHGLVSLS